MLGVEKNRSPNIIVPFYIKIIMHMHTYRYAYTGINIYRRPKSSWKNSYRNINLPFSKLHCPSLKLCVSEYKYTLIYIHKFI